ncbi:hypothetical protein R1flu_006307 [Riccia fluitans]|uniref:Uncharacterized protein n=1 Tax=Riccia fluitans TaxID=41844 RepID=A0ABD1YVV1_9MARC
MTQRKLKKSSKGECGEKLRYDIASLVLIEGGNDVEGGKLLSEDEEHEDDEQVNEDSDLKLKKPPKKAYGSRCEWWISALLRRIHEADKGAIIDDDVFVDPT